MTSTARTLDLLRKRGIECGVVERYNQFTKRRHDLFGVIDIIGMSSYGIFGIQSCGQAFSEHKKKILGSDKAFQWLQSGGELILIGWRKLKKKRGGEALIWTPREYNFIESDWMGGDK